MNTPQLLEELQRYYAQKQALINKKYSPEYNKEQYNHLMNFYNGKIKEYRSRIDKKAPEELLKYDANRADEKTTRKRIELGG
ncbi:hypothetical protein V2647_03765 [Tenacibaculum maritimum]|uniref:hypothetical protein n=1 Tax=Tenacibaculum maritimum TaxID=107401 RepID=UPI0038770629